MGRELYAGPEVGVAAYVGPDLGDSEPRTRVQVTLMRYLPGDTGHMQMNLGQWADLCTAVRTIGHVGPGKVPAAAVTCSLTIDGLCDRPAAQLLLVRLMSGAPWQTFPRCAEHGADGYEALIQRTQPLAEVVVVTLGEVA